MLGWKHGRLLFVELFIRGAFDLPGMRQQYRDERHMTSEQIYEDLRNQGARYIPGRNGWFLFGRRIMFSGVEVRPTNKERESETIRLQGGFKTPGINEHFRNTEEPLCPTDWEIFEDLKRMGMHWSSQHHVWFDESGIIAFFEE